MDQGRLAGREDDAAQLPSVPIERGVALAECDRLQSGQPVATASVAEEDWELVADELAAAAAGEDGRSACETCALLLALAGRRTSESEAVRQHAENDRGAAAAERVANQETANRALRSHLVGRSVSGEAGWRRGSDQAR